MIAINATLLRYISGSGTRMMINITKASRVKTIKHAMPRNQDGIPVRSSQVNRRVWLSPGVAWTGNNSSSPVSSVMVKDLRFFEIAL